MTMRFVRGVYIDDTAIVRGDVRLGRDVSVWPHVSIRGDVAMITVGDATNIQDGAVLHCDDDAPLTIGSRVTVGHNAVIHGVTVGDDALIGMGATMLGGSTIGNGAMLAAGAVLAPGSSVPDGMLAVGVPAKVVRPVKDEEREHNRVNGEHYVRLARMHADNPNDPRTRAYA